MSDTTGNISNERLSADIREVMNNVDELRVKNSLQLDRIEQMVTDLHQLVIGAIGNIQDAQVNGTGMQRMVANQLPDFSQLNIPAPREY